MRTFTNDFLAAFPSKSHRAFLIITNVLLIDDTPNLKWYVLYTINIGIDWSLTIVNSTRSNGDLTLPIVEIGIAT